MKAFFEKYIHECDEELALNMIHKKIHKIIRNYESKKNYTKELTEARMMIDDLLSCKTG